MHGGDQELHDARIKSSKAGVVPAAGYVVGRGS